MVYVLKLLAQATVSELFIPDVGGALRLKRAQPHFMTASRPYNNSLSLHQIISVLPLVRKKSQTISVQSN